MKNVLLVLILVFSFNVGAQPEAKITTPFLRVYNLEGKKIGKGKMIAISEENLQLYDNGKYFEIMASDIGLIKTKRSAANNILVGAGAGAMLMAGLGTAATSGAPRLFSSSPDEGATSGFLFGAVLGAAIGGITVPVKNPISFPIHGDKLRWKDFMGVMVRQ